MHFTSLDSVQNFVPYSSYFFHVYMAGGCSLECTITLLQVTEPLEDRMEQALFSPPLSKQRVDYAVQHIKESCASSLVCGLAFVDLFRIQN